MKTKIIIFFLGNFLLVACKPAQKIVYKTDDIQLATNNKLDVSISIQPFEDARSEAKIHQTQLQAKNVVQKINNKQTCINAEELYKIPVGTQMADILSKHLIKKGYFKVVSVNQKELADYYVEAKIKHFYGTQDYSTAAAVGASFGLIGAIATAGLKTDGLILIELEDICIYNKEHQLVAKLDNFKKKYEGKFLVDANCYCIYQNLNEKLKEFNEELLAIIWQDVQQAQTINTK